MWQLLLYCVWHKILLWTMPKCYLTRVETFSAAHRLFNDQLTPTDNERIFGKCSNANGHGHNYKLEVTVFGNVCARTGMVMNLTTLKEVISRCILDRLDHKHLDLDVGYFRDSKIISTSENVAIFIWTCLRSEIDQNLSIKVKLFETKNNIFTYCGD